MKIILAVFITSLSMLILGLGIGYNFGVYNQLYYDAPAKISLYALIIEQGKAEEYLNGQITYQTRLLNQPGFMQKSELLLIFPPHGFVSPVHGSNFKGTYNYYLSKIEKNKKYIEAHNLICNIGKEEWACK